MAQSQQFPLCSANVFQVRATTSGCQKKPTCSLNVEKRNGEPTPIEIFTPPELAALL